MLRRGAVPALLAAAVLAACGGSDDDPGEADLPGIVAAAIDAVDAVEEELGAGQEYFEVTSTSQLTNVFVAVDEATAAVPYVYLDGELQPPAPELDGAEGATFTADAIDVEPGVLDRIEEELPGASVEAFSVEGGPPGAVRYVVAVRAESGGALDVVVAADGAIAAVDPL